MATAKKTAKSAGVIPPREVVLVIDWKRSYASRFTDPKGGRKPVVLKPGPNDITDDQIVVLEKHRDRLAVLEKAGHLSLEQPAARVPPSSPRPPSSPAHELTEDERAELEDLRRRVATSSSTSTSPASTSTSSAEDDDGGKATPLPDWTPASSYEELKAAATARGIEFPHNVSKAKLLEDLETWDDEQLLGDDDEADDKDQDAEA